MAPVAGELRFPPLWWLDSNEVTREGMPAADYSTGGPPSSGPEGLFSGYGRDPAFYDELFDRDGVPHEHCRELWSALQEMPGDALLQLQERAERSFLHEGITFSVYGEESAQERIIPIDIIPRLVSARERVGCSPARAHPAAPGAQLLSRGHLR